ncbi:MAG: RNA polymerase sigma factor [bacterium]
MYTGSLTLVLDSDKEILQELESGNSERGATAFVRKYQNFVFSTALRYLKSYDDADDAAQEVFIKALKNIKQFREESSLKTWLYRITFNVSTNMLRKKKIFGFFKGSPDTDNEFEDEWYNLADSSPNPEQKYINAEFEDRFLKLLMKLPEKQRETFALRYFDELPYEDISKLLGTSVGGLKANYFQATKKLAVYLKDSKQDFKPIKAV